MAQPVRQCSVALMAVRQELSVCGASCVVVLGMDGHGYGS